MKIADVSRLDGIRVLVGGDSQREVTGCYVSDLLSDVLANAKEGNLWVTRQTHPNVVAVVSVRGLSGVIITAGRAVEPETMAKAEAEDITLLSASGTTFEIVGEVYNLLRAKDAAS
jgi:hypothetical protein